mmetsp:Transcript_15406/g.50257  ORF Transcript_15406/g.50257 Transcript_15406/m.50257 type:complete len:247 (-) Transcript_15406:948-1688(-)
MSATRSSATPSTTAPTRPLGIISSCPIQPGSTPARRCRRSGWTFPTPTRCMRYSLRRTTGRSACGTIPCSTSRRPPSILSSASSPTHHRRVHCASRCRAARSPSRGRTSSSSLDVPSSASSRFCTSFSPPRASNGGATAPSPPPQLSRTPPQPTFSFKSTVSSCSATSTWRASLRMRTSMRASGCLARVDRCPHRPRRCPHKRSPSRESRKPIAHASTRHQLPTASATLGRPRRRLLLARIIRRPF